MICDRCWYNVCSVCTVCSLIVPHSTLYFVELEATALKPFAQTKYQFMMCINSTQIEHFCTLWTSTKFLNSPRDKEQTMRLWWWVQKVEYLYTALVTFVLSSMSIFFNYAVHPSFWAFNTMHNCSKSLPSIVSLAVAGKRICATKLIKISVNFHHKTKHFYSSHP